MAKLTSRERIRRALSHAETDRIPIDIGGIYNLTTLHRDAYKNLMGYLGHDNEITITNINSQSVLPDEYVRKQFNGDCYPLYLNDLESWRLEINQEEDGSSWYLDEWGIKWKCPARGLYYDPVGHPLKDCTMEDLEKYPWPDPRDPSRVYGLKEKAKELFESTEYSLVMNGPLGGGIYVPCQWLMGYENFFIKMITNPEIISAMLNRIVDYHIAQWDVILDEVGKYVDVVVLSDDLGTQEFPIMNPDTYRELIKPAHSRVVNFLKSKADVKVVYHCDGAVREFIQDFIDIGIDAWNPVQVSAQGLDDTAALKKDFGDKMSFWGAACDSQHILSRKSPEEIRQEVKRRVYDLAPGGGLVLSSIHNIQKDVPVENIIAFYEALNEYAVEFYKK